MDCAVGIFFYFTHDLNKRFFLCSAAGAAGGGEKSSLSSLCDGE